MKILALVSTSLAGVVLLLSSSVFACHGWGALTRSQAGMSLKDTKSCHLKAKDSVKIGKDTGTLVP